jgi:hypothetical protein
LGAVPILLLAILASTTGAYSSHDVSQELNPQPQLLKALVYHSATSAVKQACVGDSEGEAKQASVGDKEGEAKQASAAQSLKYSDDKGYIDNVDVDSEEEFCLSFPRDRDSRNFILGGPQRPDMMGMTLVEEEAAMKKYRKERKSFTDKSRLSLMKSMAIKGIATSPQKSQLGYFGGDQNKMV